MNTTKKSITNKDLKRRIVEISFKHKLSHLGSCLTAVDIIDEIYKTKKKDEKFVLSSGHAGLALYVVIEKYEGVDAQKIFEHHGVHPDRCEECHLYCSSGSLGQGLPIAVGMALANRGREMKTVVKSKTTTARYESKPYGEGRENVYCLISDGEYAEGSIHEALEISAKNHLKNLKMYINMNGWGGYRATETLYSGYILQAQGVNIFYTYVGELPFLKGLDAHYYKMTKKDYQLAMKLLV